MVAGEPVAAARSLVAGQVTLRAVDVRVSFRVFEDQRPTLRKLVSSRFKPRTYREVHAVRGVSLDARAGETIGLIGSNGSGKSTLLTALAGLLPLDGGRVEAVAEPRLLGIKAALLPDLSARRNILLGGLALGLTRSEIAARFDEIIDFAGVRAHVDMPLRTFSSGMAARLHFSLASTVRPRILFIDEALSVGDEDFRHKSEGRLRELRERSGTVVVVSHNLSALQEMCTRVVWLDDGCVRGDGAPGAIIDAYRSKAAADRGPS
jgi:teichoic acid transport system ATP-binding protein